MINHIEGMVFQGGVKPELEESLKRWISLGIDLIGTLSNNLVKIQFMRTACDNDLHMTLTLK